MYAFIKEDKKHKEKNQLLNEKGKISHLVIRSIIMNYDILSKKMQSSRLAYTHERTYLCSTPIRCFAHR